MIGWWRRRRRARGYCLTCGARMFGVERAPEETDEQMLDRVRDVVACQRPFTVADWLDLIDQHRPVGMTHEQVLRELLNHLAMQKAHADG